ncbi:Hypothetical protein R9X50_00154000 [Acrodontium crateriforme]|uniref:Uncharacterized protein n=1 Tax=Acrodontium crateriforme TaxID=150365 RepID=A0AAQ3M0L9_9PEZI|nr:Hypothetical protein R9X50_00154000 [Acrodontium crateriforme]
MAEAIATIQTVKWATDTLWEFYRLLGRYNGLPGRVLDLESNLHACEMTLRRWKTKWGVENRQPDIYYEVLFSKRGWRAIRICLGMISESSQIVKGKINALVGSALKHQGKSRNKVYDGKFDIEIMRRAMKRIDRHMSRKIRFAWAVTLKIDDLESHIERFNKNLTNLERFAESYLSETHPELFGKEAQQLKQEAQLLVEDKIRDKIKKKVTGSREDAESLHKAYVGDTGLMCHLSVCPTTSTQTRRDSRLAKDFHFLIANGSKSMEILVHPVQFNKSDNVSRLPTSMSEAFNSVSAYSRKPGDLLPPGATDGNGFELRIASKPILTPLWGSAPLSTLFKASQGDANRVISTRDKISIATGLIEGCYRLLSTPWLNYLDSANIRGARNPEDATKWDAMLSCEAGNRSVSKALACFASQPGNRLRDLRQHTQIFRLGLVLAELATGSLVTYAEASEDFRTPGVSIVMPDLADDERLDADEVAAAVELHSGERYADFVRFCLSMLQMRSKIKLTSVDEHYESMLLNPARDMAGLLV